MKAIICDASGCENMLRDGDLHVITAKWAHYQRMDLGGHLQPDSKAKAETHYCSLACAQNWAETELARIAEVEAAEELKRSILTAEDMDAPDDELWEDDDVIDVPHRELQQLAAGSA